jgi:hypothetical protein
MAKVVPYVGVAQCEGTYGSADTGVGRYGLDMESYGAWHAQVSPDVKLHPCAHHNSLVVLIWLVMLVSDQ